VFLGLATKRQSTDLRDNEHRALTVVSDSFVAIQYDDQHVRFVCHLANDAGIEVLSRHFEKTSMFQMLT